MWNLRAVMIVALLVMSSLIFPSEFDESVEECGSVGGGEFGSVGVVGVLGVEDTEKPSDVENEDGFRSPSRPAPDDAHGGSWLDSFEDDSGVNWAMSDHLRLVEGDAKIKGTYGLDPNAVAVWHFDEGSGTTAFDETSNNNDGIIYGASWIAGKYGKALSFDGVDDYINVPDDPSLRSSTYWTIEFWLFRSTDSGQKEGLISKSAISDGAYEYNGDFTVWIRNMDKLAIGVQTTASNTPSLDSISIINTQTWYHVVVTINSSDINNMFAIYLNGELDIKGGLGIVGPLRQSTRPLAFGRFGNVYNFNGILDEIVLYNRGLTASEIKQHYLYGYNYVNRNVNLTSKSIQLPTNMCWDTLRINKTEPQDTSLNVTILDGTTNQLIPGFQNLTGTELDISSINPIAHNSIKLQASFDSNGQNTSILHDWSVNWTENTAPRFIDIKLPSTVYRTKSVQICINVSDREESEENLTIKVEYKGSSYPNWVTNCLSTLYFSKDHWNCYFNPAEDNPVGNYSFRITINDSFQYLNTTTHLNLIEVINNKPTQPDVYISPVNPRTTDDFTVFARNSSDADMTKGGEIEGPIYWYRWYKNGSHLTEFDDIRIIPNTETQKGDTWRCFVHPFDGIDLGIPGEAEVVIQNTPPELVESFTELEMWEDVPVILEEKLLKMFTDVDSDVLTFSVSGHKNINVEIMQANGTINLTPANDWFGTETITFYANDTFSPAATQTVHVTVKPTNDLPMIVQVGSQVVVSDDADIGFDLKQNDKLNLSIVVQDVDGDVERGMIQFFMNISERSNLYLLTNEHKLIFHPRNEDVGLNFINISITDNNETPPEYVYQNIWFNVINVNDPPTVKILEPESNKEFLETDDITFICEADDPDLLIPSANEKFTYLWYTNKTELVTLGAEQQILVTNRTLPAGYYTVTVRAKDTAGKTAYDHVDIVVKAVPKKQQPTTEPKDTALGIDLWLWILIIIIIIIVIAILGILISKRKKRKLEDLGIKEEPEDVLKPEEAYKVEVSMASLAQAKEASSTAQFPKPTIDQPQVTPPQQAIDSQPLAPTVAQPGLASETTAVITPTLAETPTIPSVVQPQLPPAPEPTVEPETPPETVTPTVEPPAPETEPEPTADLPPDAYEQAEGPQPQVQEPTAETPQPPPTPQTTQTLTPIHSQTPQPSSQQIPTPTPQTPTPTHPQTQPLMTQCPLCQQQIAEYSNPCPHCGGELQWGDSS